MLRKAILGMMPLALVAGALVGCAGPQGGTTGGPTLPAGAANRVLLAQTPAERAGEQPAVAWGTKLLGDKRNLAEGLVRAAWVQANIAAGEWEQAGEDLAVVEDRVLDLERSSDVPKEVRQMFVIVQGEITKLARQILEHDREAARGAKDLIGRLSAIMATEDVINWMRQATNVTVTSPVGLPMVDSTSPAVRGAAANP